VVIVARNGSLHAVAEKRYGALFRSTLSIKY